MSARPAGPTRQLLALGLIVVVGALLIGLNLRSRAGAEDEPVYATQPAPQSNQLVYVSLGDSLSRGVQPDESLTLRNGYPRQLAEQLGLKVPSARFVEAGCGGATTQSFIEGGRPCQPDAPIPYEDRGKPTAQLAWAEQALDRRGDRPTLVTLTIGGNDLTPCATTKVEEIRQCFDRRLPDMQARLREIAARLAEAAGSDTMLVVTTTYDPFLSFARVPATRAAARAFHSIVVDEVNPALRRIFRAEGWRVADVGAAVYEGQRVRGSRSRPVAAVCALSWACSRGDIHLNNEGYGLVADLISAEARAAFPQARG